MINKIVVLVLIPLIFVQSMGCYSYQTTKLQDIEQTEKIEKAKITTIDGQSYDLEQITIKEDRVSGLISISVGERFRGKQKEEIEIPFSEIKKFEIRKANTETSSSLLVLFVLGIIALVSFYQSDPLLR